MQNAIQEATVHGPRSPWREWVTRFAMVPLGLLIIAPFVFMLLLGLFLCVVMVLRMSPVRPENHSRWQADAERQALEQARLRRAA